MSRYSSSLLLLALLCLSSCTSVFLQPDHVLYFPPEKFGYHAEEVQIPSGDGTKLTAWHFPCFPCQKPKGTIVQLHGNAENISSHYMSLAWITRYGYDLWIGDYRGYGGSEGSPDIHGSVEDTKAIIRQALASHIEQASPKFIVYAQSLGGAFAMRALEEMDERSQVDFLVLDSTFASYQKMASGKLSDHVLTWLFTPLAYVLVSDRNAPKENLALLTMPKLQIHDKGDAVVEFRNGQSLYDALPEPKEFWELDKGRHVGIFAVDTIENRKGFLTRLDKAFGFTESGLTEPAH